MKKKKEWLFVAGIFLLASYPAFSRGWQGGLDSGYFLHVLNQTGERGVFLYRLLVVLTHPRDYVRKPDPMQKLLHRTYRDYPNFLHVMEHRAHVYNENREELFRLERQGKVKVILPDSTMGVSRTERDPEKLRLLWAKGYQMAVDRMEELKDYFTP